MENLYLLSELLEILQKEKIILERELASLEKERLELDRKQKVITDKMRAKKTETASITEERIEKYKTFWKSLGGNNAPPCPFCFLVHGKQSDLKSLPERKGIEPLICGVCKKEFHLPVPG